MADPVKPEQAKPAPLTRRDHYILAVAQAVIPQKPNALAASVNSTSKQIIQWADALLANVDAQVN